MEISETIRARIQDMTLEEKCLLLTGSGSLRTGYNERLGIGYLELNDGDNGVRRLIDHPWFPQICHIEGGDTCFPTASAMSCSWNRELVGEVAHGIANDCRQEHVDMLLAPAINMKRSPLCGRNFEYYSEDPVLAGELAGAYIRGMQAGGVGTCLKHFAANNQEQNRQFLSVEADERTLREYYLEAFRIAIEKGQPEAVMCAYNKLCGIWCSENRWLLTEVLRDEWHYTGVVVSDWRAVHDNAKALAAGLQLQMPQEPEIVAGMQRGLDTGIITEADITRAAEQVLALTEHRIAQRNPSVPYDRAAQHRLAYRAATECITLLKNEGGLLPVVPERYPEIALFGEGAEHPVFEGGSHVTVDAALVESPLPFLKAYCDGKTTLTYEPLFDSPLAIRERRGRIRKLAETAPLALVFVTNEYGSETEGDDRLHFGFAERIHDALEVIVQEFEQVIVVMQTGACTGGTGWEERCAALVQMGLCGEAGGSAIADVLFGKINPSGKLSETFSKVLAPHYVHSTPSHHIVYREGLAVGYRYFDRHPELVAYPFGHGLSYTTFAYSDLSVTPDTAADPTQSVAVSFTVTNTGDRAGKEIVQLYVRPEESVVVRPEKELKAFEKVSLSPGESRRVILTLDAHAFSYYNPCLHDWHVESGRYDILVGASSQDIRLRGGFSVTYPTDYTRANDRKDLILQEETGGEPQ